MLSVNRLELLFTYFYTVAAPGLVLEEDTNLIHGINYL